MSCWPCGQDSFAQAWMPPPTDPRHEARGFCAWSLTAGSGCTSTDVIAPTRWLRLCQSDRSGTLLLPLCGARDSETGGCEEP